MTAYVLIPGAGGASSYWCRVAPLLERAGQDVVAVDLPGPDPEAGLPQYADLVVSAAKPFPSVVLVAQSMGGFTAAMAAERLPVHELILVNAMIPVPGERPGEWWDATGSVEAREAAANGTDTASSTSTRISCTTSTQLDSPMTSTTRTKLRSRLRASFAHGRNA